MSKQIFFVFLISSSLIMIKSEFSDVTIKMDRSLQNLLDFTYKKTSCEGKTSELKDIFTSLPKKEQQFMEIHSLDLNVDLSYLCNRKKNQMLLDGLRYFLIIQDYAYKTKEMSIYLENHKDFKLITPYTKGSQGDHVVAASTWSKLNKLINSLSDTSKDYVKGVEQLNGGLLTKCKNVKDILKTDIKVHKFHLDEVLFVTNTDMQSTVMNMADNVVSIWRYVDDFSKIDTQSGHQYKVPHGVQGLMNDLFSLKTLIKTFGLMSIDWLGVVRMKRKEFVRSGDDKQLNDYLNAVLLS